jgi:hypothetical protein
MADALPIFVFNFISSIFHGLIFVLGFVLLKYAKNWLSVLGLVLGVIAVSVCLTLATFFFQGAERAWSMMVPGGEMFAVMGLPVIISAVISTMMIMFSAYILFVEPGNQKNV